MLQNAGIYFLYCWITKIKIKSSKYDFKIKYLPGLQMFIADLLSRSYLKGKVYDDPELKEVVHSVEKELPIKDDRLEEICEKN